MCSFAADLYKWPSNILPLTYVHDKQVSVGPRQHMQTALPTVGPPISVGSGCRSTGRRLRQTLFVLFFLVPLHTTLCETQTDHQHRECDRFIHTKVTASLGFVLCVITNVNQASDIFQASHCVAGITGVRLSLQYLFLIYFDLFFSYINNCTAHI